MSGDSSQSAHSRGTKPLSREPQPPTEFGFVTQPLGRLRGRAVVHRIARLQIAADTQTREQCDHLFDRLLTQLPNPAAVTRTIPLRQRRQFEVRLFQQ
jgi:hypothetical protein